MRFPYRDFKRDWHPGDSFCRCRSIKMRFYRHIDTYKVEFMLNKYLKRWVQFADTVIWVTNTTEYTELIGSEVASKWFSHSWMTALMLPKQAHPGRRSPRARFAGTGGFAARGGGHITMAADDLVMQGGRATAAMISTHWGRDKMAAVFQTTFSNGFSLMKMYEIQLTFHWSLFLWVQLTIFQQWFR